MRYLFYSFLLAVIVLFGCDSEKQHSNTVKRDSLNIKKGLNEFTEPVDNEKAVAREVYDSSKVVYITLPLNGEKYSFSLFLNAHPNGDTSEYARSGFHCDSITVVPQNTFSIEFSEFLKTGRYPLDGYDTVSNYNDRWVVIGSGSPKEGYSELVRLIDINRDGYMDILVNDIQKEEITNSLTDYWIYVPALKRLKHIPDLTAPNWGIKVGKKRTLIKSGWHMRNSENNVSEFYIVDTLLK